MVGASTEAEARGELCLYSQLCGQISSLQTSSHGERALWLYLMQQGMCGQSCAHSTALLIPLLRSCETTEQSRSLVPSSLSELGPVVLQLSLRGLPKSSLLSSDPGFQI